jgi:LacI family transcriptional regulator
MILAGVGQTASERGYALALYYADAHARADYAGAMRDGRVDGGLVIDSAVIPADQIERLEQERFPLVLVGHRLPETRTSFVAADDHAAGASVARYLIGLGHRRIVHAYFAGGHPTRQRRAGFENAMAEAGLLRPDTAIEDTIGDMPGSLDHTPLVRELLSRDERPTAIFAWNDTVAASFVQCATTMGVRVPHDLSVVGFNDFAIAQLTSPPLTTVRQPLFDMGRTAADLLIGRIEGERQGGSVDWPAQRVLSAELVERGSTAEPGS